MVGAGLADLGTASDPVQPFMMISVDGSAQNQYLRAKNLCALYIRAASGPATTVARWGAHQDWLFLVQTFTTMQQCI